MHITIVICALFLGIHIYGATSLPLSGEEAYYWTWSQHWSWGYWHHPPMIAYGIGMATTIFSKTEIGVRFFGIFLHVISSYLLSTKTQKPNQSLLLFLTLPGLALAGMEAHPQIYFFSFFALTLWAWLSKHWVLMGIFLSFCFLSATSSLALIPFLGLLWTLVPQYRKKLSVAFIIGFIGSLPWFLWLLFHNALPLGLLYNLKPVSFIISGLDLFFYVGCIAFAPILQPKDQEQKFTWAISLFLVLSTLTISPQFMGIGWGVAGVLYVCHRFPDRFISVLLGIHMFMFAVQKINLHRPLLASDVHIAQKYNGGAILADAVQAWGIEHVWTTSPFDAAWIRFYSNIQAHTNGKLGSESQFDLWKKPFPNYGLLVQEDSRFFSIANYSFSDIQTITSYADSHTEGDFIQTHQWNTAIFQLSSSTDVVSPNNDAD